jgi:hypothetical protein
MFSSRVLLLFLFVFSSLAHGHGPTRQKVKESVVINVPAADSWKMIRNLDFAEKWHSVYSSILPGEKFVKFTSKRDGSKGLIEILSSSDKSMKFKYRLKNPSSIPVNNYSANISVMQVGSTSKVTFKGAFYRKYVNNDPPPGEDDEAAIKAVTEIYKTSLTKLKKKLEEN